MPFTPFLGLSIIVHLCIILYCRFFQRSEPSKIAKVIVVPKRFFSNLIVASVFVVVIGNAAFLLDIGLNDKYSSLLFISHMMSKTTNIIPSLDSVMRNGGQDEIFRDWVKANNTKYGVRNFYAESSPLFYSG